MQNLTWLKHINPLPAARATAIHVKIHEKEKKKKIEIVNSKYTSTS